MTATPGARSPTGLDQAARRHGETTFAHADEPVQRKIVGAFADGSLNGQIWDQLPAKTAWTVVMRSVLSAFYSHPWTWNEIGFGGPAYPRGYMRLAEGPAGAEPDEAPEAFGLDPVAGRPTARDAMRTTVKRLAKGAVGPVETTRASCSMSTAAAFPAGPRWPATATRMRSTC